MKFESLADNLFLTTTRIETSSKVGMGIATGFCFQYNLDKKGAGVRFFVTNKHVIENKTIITLQTPIALPDGSPDLIKRFSIACLESDWYKHESYDLALSPASSIFNDMEKEGKPLAQKTFDNSHIPSETQRARLHHTATFQIRPKKRGAGYTKVKGEEAKTRRPLKVFEYGKKYSIGSVEVVPYEVDHSLPGARALCVISCLIVVCGGWIYPFFGSTSTFRCFSGLS